METPWTPPCQPMAHEGRVQPLDCSVSYTGKEIRVYCYPGLTKSKLKQLLSWLNDNCDWVAGVRKDRDNKNRLIITVAKHIDELSLNRAVELVEEAKTGSSRRTASGQAATRRAMRSRRDRSPRQQFQMKYA